MIQREIGQQTIVPKERWSDIMDVISEYWEEDYYVTNVMHDGTDWIVIMTEVPECRNQSLILNTDWGARRAAFKPYFFLSFILGSRVRKPADFREPRSSGFRVSRAREMP